MFLTIQKEKFDDMRFSLATASCAVVISALLGGCSSSQGTQSLPGSTSTSVQPMGHVNQIQYLPKKGQRLSPLALLKLQAAGKLPGNAPRAMLEKQLKQIESGPRPRLKFRPAAGVGMWVTNESYSYLLGQNKGGKKNLTAANVEDNGCYYPITVQVDSSNNPWISCEYNSDFAGSAVQEYTSSGSLENTYNGGCPGGSSGCDYWYAYSFSAGQNANYVESSQTFTEEEICNPSCEYYYGSGFEWWPKGEPSASPTFINVGEDCDPVCDTYYSDVDDNNNIYFTYYGFSGSVYGYGLAEITNAFSPSWQMVSLLPPGALGFAGGVYVSNHGTVLNVTDQEARTTTQYALPWTGSSTDTLGPTSLNAFNCGDPVTGGFNSTSTKAVYADACAWLDLGTISTNKWKAKAGVNFSGIDGAAYSPSDR